VVLPIVVALPEQLVLLVPGVVYVAVRSIVLLVNATAVTVSIFLSPPFAGDNKTTAANKTSRTEFLMEQEYHRQFRRVLMWG